MTLFHSRTHSERASIAKDLPRSEYPRPDLDRSDRWLNLNGTWQLEYDGRQDPITVPFSWESEASGIHRVWLERAIYRRLIAVPEAWHDARVILCFGAVHHHAVVRIDGTEIGAHSGGYEAFEFDITDFVMLGIESELVVDVTAPADKREIPHGKQRSIPRDDYDGVSFTPSSGIWQTVWIEARGRTYARTITLRGDSLTGIDFTIGLAGDHVEGQTVTASIGGTTIRSTVSSDEGGVATGRLELDQPRLWSPQDPHLYQIEVVTGDGDGCDRVTATTGLRRIEARGEHLFLNGDRFYLRGVLDQGYWPDTGLTAPSASALLGDLDLARNLGYNLVRKHLKFEEPLWLHEADRMGMLVWAEPANPSRYSPTATRAFEAQLPAMVERDGNHPSIVIWGLYNEEWGLDWDIPGSTDHAEAARRAYTQLRSLDSSRLIVENSGWSHLKTDLVDWHYYEPDLAEWAAAVCRIARGTQESFPVRLAPDFVVHKSLYEGASFPRHGLPIINSEYGEGFTSIERAWHLRWETQELRRHDRFAGYVYTELIDVEHESAGIYYADRRSKDWGGCRPADINAETVLVMNLVPLRAGADITIPQHSFDLSLHVSHHGSDTVRGQVHAAWAPPGTPVGEGRVLASQIRSANVVAHPFQLSRPTTIAVPPPSGPARLMIWLENASGGIVARSFVDAAVVEPHNRRGSTAS